MREVEQQYGKLGHLGPCGCPNAQLYQADDGLRCPKCNEVFQPAPKADAEIEPPKRRKPKGE